MTTVEPATQAQATALIRLLEADGAIMHDEWYPELGTAKLRYTCQGDGHRQMWELEIRRWAGWNRAETGGGVEVPD